MNNPEQPKDHIEVKDAPKVTIRNRFGGFVISFVTIIMFIGFVAMALLPYISAFSGNQVAVGLAASIRPNETYGIIIGSILSFWLGTKVGASK